MVSMPNETSGPAAKKDYSALYLPVSIIFAGLIISGGLFFGLSGKAPMAANGQPEPVKVNIKDVNIKDAPFIGNANAPVTMAYWSDFQCPFCKAVDVGGIPQIAIEPSFPILIEKYVNAGKLKIVFKDYPFLGEDSITAAEYGRAVWEMYPDKYYAWREAMMHSQDEEHGGFGDEPSILALIKKIPGMDAAKLKALVAQKKDVYVAAMKADQQEGVKFGVRGTPGFIIGEQSIDGAVGPERFIEVIEALLK
jgi:protein-disulfide isomerase